MIQLQIVFIIHNYSNYCDDINYDQFGNMCKIIGML